MAGNRRNLISSASDFCKAASGGVHNPWADASGQSAASQSLRNQLPNPGAVYGFPKWVTRKVLTPTVGVASIHAASDAQVFPDATPQSPQSCPGRLSRRRYGHVAFPSSQRRLGAGRYIAANASLPLVPIGYPASKRAIWSSDHVL